MLKHCRYRPREYDSEDGPWEPISGATAALMGTIGSMMMGIADMPVDILKALKFKPPEGSTSPNPVQTPATADQASTTDLTPQSTNMSSEAPSLAGDGVGSSTTDGQFCPNQISGAQCHNIFLGEITRQNTASTETANDSGPLTEQASSSASGSTPSISHRNAMARALSGSLTSSGSVKRSDSGSPRPPHQRTFSGSGKVTLEAALGAGKGVGKIVGAGLKSPMDFTMGLAQGFHNAPKLYGDDTVRQADKITGFQSGLKAAGKVSTIFRSVDSVLTRL